MHVTWMVTWGLFLTWVLHDAEELATMPGWAARAEPRLHRLYPWVPVRVWRALNRSRTQVGLAVALMGLVVATAAAAGAASGGRSELFQIVLLANAVHGVGHVLLSVLTRGYTPGVVTAPVLVIGFSAWAWSRLGADGLLRADASRAWWSLAALPALGAAWLLTFAVLRAATANRRPGRPRPPG